MDYLILITLLIIGAPAGILCVRILTRKPKRDIGCGCKGDCGCADCFEQSARWKKHFEEHGSIFNQNS